jgi:hypothetical protein
MSCDSRKSSLKMSAFRSCATSSIHFSFSTASRTDLCFRLLCWYRRGKRSVGDCPSIQLDSQNEAFLPSCTLTLVAAVKRSRMPSPPTCTGLATSGQATLHFPHVISPSSAHRKRLRNLSSSCSICFGALIDVSIYIGIELRTDCTSSLLPAGFSSRPCQPVPCLIHYAL